MAKGNGRLTANAVGEWFSAMQFEEQQKVLSGLQSIHGKVRQVKIDGLKRELAVLENGSANGHAPPKAAKRGPKKGKKGSVRVKYRDPKSDDTWSGRGRMAGWLAEKVKAGEKQDKYLA
jgi:DNA-binding protein H-NS